ncbi:MAG: DUF86 domain-containing protein [Bacteroidota bacterium]|nr:DUF86 domain-containing protein [Bacteroidota bacterium]
MKFNGVIENKLRIIEGKVTDIESWNIASYNEFKNNSLVQNAVERALQVAVEAMIDCSERILSQLRVPPAASGSENFDALQKHGIISDAAVYKDMVRFRNFIVHRYEQIDPEIVYSIASRKLNLFAQFVDEIRKA